MKSPVILAVNSGSSSIKFAMYPFADAGVGRSNLTGVIEGLQPGGEPVIQFRAGTKTQTLTLDKAAIKAVKGDQFAAALADLHSLLMSQSADMQIVAVAHRIVHGGARFSASIVIDDAALAYLHSLDTLAPLHQPHNLEGVAAFRRAYPGIPQIACFDTGFHADMPTCESTLALPQSLRATGIRRYGFHGLSYRYVASHLALQSTRAFDPAAGRVIMLHLGNGASACAMRNGKSIASSMGFSALDGLMMGTRCGALDPGVLLHLMQQGWDGKRIETTLYKESGLLGISGISADMRTLRASSDPQASFAIDLFTYRVIRECGALSACLNGLDVLVFTGGIGEHDAALRQQVVQGLAYLGVQVDAEKNQAARGDDIMSFHTPGSKIEVWIVPTDEGRVAAMDAQQLLRSDTTNSCISKAGIYL
ncbi:acetate/propionate family kinase [Undibacterium pigrum]|uniref:Acetate kinase n=1 Tax=Undibacterium pigrum TaxID=401470 RepID=A0A318IZU6_9BURK|nr:acetate/propionate family kinase [Undibacterium pigrum]PXX39921.1 acetate kinase [Undibacterium pigrum]